MMDVVCQLQRMTLCLRLLLSLLVLTSADSSLRHFIIISVSDLGFNDASFNGGSIDARLTPNLHDYARAQVTTVFNNYYVAPSAHATRSALLTGRHPAHLGTQFDVKDWTKEVGLDHDVPLFPEALQKVGYKTHAVGVWDLGFYSKDHLPEQRGFDSFSGSYLPYGDYITHYASDQAGHSGFDMHIKGKQKSLTDFKPELYANISKQIIDDHHAKHSDKPLYLHVALQAPRISDVDSVCATGSASQKIPNDYWRKVPSSVTDPTRRCYLALLAAIDGTFGVIMNALQAKEMLTNSIVLFTSTSGGAAAGPDFNAASNSPFRGSKMTGWEGGVRGTALLYNSIHTNIPPSKCLLHVTDWIPTLARFLPPEQYDRLEKLQSELRKWNMYGVDQFDCIFKNADSRRSSIIHFLYGDSYSMVKDNYKIMFDGSNHISGMDEWYSTHQNRLITCPGLVVECQPQLQTCLYNLELDLCERNNLGSREEYLQIIDSMKEELRSFDQTVVYTADKKIVSDPEGNPGPGRWWGPWVESGAWSTAPRLGVLIMSILSCLLVSLLR